MNKYLIVLLCVFNSLWSFAQVNLNQLAQGGATSTQVLAWDGSKWAPAANGVASLQAVTDIGNKTTRSIRSDSMIVVRGNQSTFTGLQLLNTTSITGNNWWLRSFNDGTLRLSRGSSAKTAQWLFNDYYNTGSGYFGKGTTTVEAPVVMGTDSTTSGVISGIENKMANAGAHAQFKAVVNTSGGDASILFATTAATKGHMGYYHTDGNIHIGMGASFGSGNDKITITTDGVGLGGAPDANLEFDNYGDTRMRGLLVQDIESMSGTGTVAASTTRWRNVFAPGSTQATFTVTLPPNPFLGQLCHLHFKSEITALTLDPGTNSVEGGNTFGTIAQYGNVTLQFDGVDWLRY